MKNLDTGNNYIFELMKKADRISLSAFFSIGVKNYVNN